MTRRTGRDDLECPRKDVDGFAFDADRWVGFGVDADTHLGCRLSKSLFSLPRPAPDPSHCERTRMLPGIGQEMSNGRVPLVPQERRNGVSGEGRAKRGHRDGRQGALNRRLLMRLEALLSRQADAHVRCRSRKKLILIPRPTRERFLGKRTKNSLGSTMKCLTAREERRRGRAALRRRRGRAERSEAE